MKNNIAEQSEGLNLMARKKCYDMLSSCYTRKFKRIMSLSKVLPFLFVSYQKFKIILFDFKEGQRLLKHIIDSLPL